MIDTSSFTLDTPVKIKISTPGLYLPELETYTPCKSYASIEQVITIMNRGIAVEFPNQEKKEISEKIEDILLDYKNRQIQLKKKFGDVGSNVDTAITTVQEINDSKISPEELRKEDEEHIFEYGDVVKRIVDDFNGPRPDFANPDIYASGEDRIKKEKERREAKARIAAKRKAALELSKLETDTLRKLAQNANFDFDDSIDELGLDTPTVFIPKSPNKH